MGGQVKFDGQHESDITGWIRMNRSIFLKLSRRLSNRSSENLELPQRFEGKGGTHGQLKGQKVFAGGE